MIHIPLITSFRALAAAAVTVATVALLLGNGAAVRADEPNPYLKPNDSWIGISGTVESVQPDRFMLNYGDGIVLVEMDDGDRDADAYQLTKGDKVTVSGRIDDDFFEQTKIEAAYVFVENLGTTFFASSVDEEDWTRSEGSVLPPITLFNMVVSGTVTKVNHDDFLIDTGDRMLRVDVSAMPFDPLDDEGYLKIDEGDRVKVLGTMDVSLFEGRQLVADTVIEIRQS